MRSHYLIESISLHEKYAVRRNIEDILILFSTLLYIQFIQIFTRKRKMATCIYLVLFANFMRSY